MKLNISENIRKNRRENNLSQEIFAERMGVSFQTISKWERYVLICESSDTLGDNMFTNEQAN